jgi:ubiquinone biosynthesis protein
MSRVLLQLFEITDLFDMHLQPQLVLLQKTMVQAEGVCRMLSPQHNMWKASAPAVTRFMRRELGPEGIARDFVRDLEALRASAMALPATLERLTLAAERLRAEPPETAQRRDWALVLAIASTTLLGAAIGAWAYASLVS